MLGKVVAVVVTYRPDFIDLTRLLDAIKHQVEQTVVVDNGSTVEVSDFLSGRNDSKVHYLCLGANYGVAAAQNAGIAWAREWGADSVVLFDQDSLPARDMVQNLLSACNALENKRTRVAAVGPRYVDPRTGQSSAVLRFGLLRYKRYDCRTVGDSYIRADFLISSGCLISLATLTQLGDMDSGLFIDHVDTEWFLRARAKGYEAYCVCDAVMEHQLGERPLKIWLGRWRTVPRHSPERYYYIFRNSILLYRRRYVAWRWVINDSKRLVAMLLIYSTVSDPRRRNVQMMIRGILDGLKGCAGRLDS